MQWLVAWVLAILALGARGAAEYNLVGRPGEGYVVEVMIGHPRQKLNILIDTGSSNFAVAGAANTNIDTYFVRENSTSLEDLSTPVTVLYTQGSWAGQLASDFVYFPTLNSVPEVRCDIAFITQTNNFYMNGSNWQGILGVAYPAISRPDAHVLSWIDSLQKTNKDRTMAFSLTLCGSRDPYHTDHYGSFEILNNVVHSMEGLLTTPVIRDWFYEVVLTGLQVDGVPVDVDCRDLNSERTIVDSGTTNIRVPHPVFIKVVDMVKAGSVEWGPVSEAFWYHSEVACWLQPQQTRALPTLTLHLLHSHKEYLLIHLPGSSYIRQVATARIDDDAEPEFCYKFGIEPSTSGSILGVAAMEGFEVIFNRTGRTVGFRESHCGPNVTISGPYVSAQSEDLLLLCSRGADDRVTMLEMAAYIVCAMLVVATVMFVYLLVQWLKDKYFRCHVTGTAVSLSHTSLINEEQ